MRHTLEKKLFIGDKTLIPSRVSSRGYEIGPVYSLTGKSTLLTIWVNQSLSKLINLNTVNSCGTHGSSLDKGFLIQFD